MAAPGGLGRADLMQYYAMAHASADVDTVVPQVRAAAVRCCRPRTALAMHFSHPRLRFHRSIDTDGGRARGEWWSITVVS